jgi:hypothetical protein
MSSAQNKYTSGAVLIVTRKWKPNQEISVTTTIDGTPLSPEMEHSLLNVLGRIDRIEEMMLKADPMLELHCAAIQKALLEQEELVHMLPDDKARMYMAGMKKYKNIKLVEEASSKRKGKITGDML